MLHMVKISKSDYDNLPTEDKLRAETMFLCKNEETNLCSIYIQGECYAEDLDEDNFIKNNDIHEWAKEPQKPTYTAEEVHAVDVNDEMSFADIKSVWDLYFN